MKKSGAVVSMAPFSLESGEDGIRKNRITNKQDHK